MFSRNRDRVLSIGIQSLGYNPKSTHRMENRVDALEQSMSKAEVAVEQLRQMVLEQQSRPQITLEQIRQLIDEEFPRRGDHHRGRPRQRVHNYHKEEEWSDNSSWSWDSPPPQTDGGNHRFYDVKEGTHHYKSEFQPKTAETAVATEKMKLLSTMAENQGAHRLALQPLSPLQKVVQPTATIARQTPPPKPTDGDLLAIARKFQIIEDPVAHTQPPELEQLDSNHSVMVLPQLIPLPKPPDPKNYVKGNGSLAKLPPSSESPAADSGAKTSPPPQTKSGKDGL
jgi:uncharacterized coiled-coil protein SlyX